MRELRNIIERAVLLAPLGKLIRPIDLPDSLGRVPHQSPAAQGRTSLKERLFETERELVKEALTRNGGVLRRAALELKINPMTLGRRARQLGVWPLAPKS